MKKAISVVLAAVGLALLLTPAAQAQGMRHDSVIFLVDNSTYEGDRDQMAVAAKIVGDMNADFPDYVRSAALVEAGNWAEPRVQWLLPIGNWDRDALAAAAQKIAPGHGPMLLAAGITESGEALDGAMGKTAIIILSNGLSANYQDTVKRIKVLKERYGDRFCVFCIQLGNKREGQKHLQDLVDAARCGKVVSASDLMSADGVQDFVDYIFPPPPAPAPMAYTPPPPAPQPVIVKPVRLDSDDDGVFDDQDQCQGTPHGARVDGRGCWEVTGTLFETGESEIRPQFRVELDEVAKVLKANPDVRLTIEGYTDSTGSDAVNMRLSQARAESVKRYLISRGISADRLTAVGRGSANPVGDNSTAEGRMQNRRIELTPAD